MFSIFQIQEDILEEVPGQVNICINAVDIQWNNASVVAINELPWQVNTLTSIYICSEVFDDFYLYMYRNMVPTFQQCVNSLVSPRLK